MECYSNCGCEPGTCTLGLPQMEGVHSAREVDRRRTPSRLRNWERITESTFVLGPHVVLTELSEEPLVLLRKQPPADVVEAPVMFFLVRFNRWVQNGCPYYVQATELGKMKYLGKAGLRKLTAVDSWYTSALPLVRDAVFNYEERRTGLALNPETIERQVRLGWPGFDLRLRYHQEPLFWWRTLSRRVKLRKPVTSVRALWDVVFRWTFWQRVLTPGAPPAISPSIETQRTKLLDMYENTNFF